MFAITAGRSIAVAAVILVLVGPIASTVSATGSVACPSGQQAKVRADGTTYATAEADAGDECGVTVDPENGRVDADLTLETLGVSVLSPVTSDAPTSYHAGDSIDPGLFGEEGLAPMVSEAAPGMDLWADDEGVHLSTPVKDVLLPWPPSAEGITVDERGIHYEDTKAVSSEQVVGEAVDIVRSRTGDEAAPVWQTWEELSPASAFVVELRLQLADVGFSPPSGPGPLAATSASSTPAPGHGERDIPDRADQASPSPVLRSSGEADNAGAHVSEDLERAGGSLLLVGAAATLLGAFLGGALYRRLQEGKVLDNSIRHRMFEFIKDQPGVTAQDLSNHLEVDYSTARHHVSVLKEFDLVHATRRGRRTHYFENHGTFGRFEKEAIPLLRDGTSSQIARLVRESPGINPSEVARELDVDRSTVKWHLDKLREVDLVQAEPVDGRSLSLVVPEPARDVVDRWT